MKFRGKRRDNKKWVEGDLILHCPPSFIRVYLPAIVDKTGISSVYSKSIGMSIMQKDKNKIEMFGSIFIKGKMTEGGDVVIDAFSSEKTKNVTGTIKWGAEGPRVEGDLFKKNGIDNVGYGGLEVIGKQCE